MAKKTPLFLLNPQNVGWVILGPSLGWKYDQAVQPAVVALSGTLWKVPFWNVPSETILDNMYSYIYIYINIMYIIMYIYNIYIHTSEF